MWQPIPSMMQHNLPDARGEVAVRADAGALPQMEDVGVRVRT